MIGLFAGFLELQCGITLELQWRSADLPVTPTWTPGWDSTVNIFCKVDRESMTDLNREQLGKCILD